MSRRSVHLRGGIGRGCWRWSATFFVLPRWGKRALFRRWRKHFPLYRQPFAVRSSLPEFIALFFLLLLPLFCSWIDIFCPPATRCEHSVDNFFALLAPVLSPSALLHRCPLHCCFICFRSCNIFRRYFSWCNISPMSGN